MSSEFLTFPRYSSKFNLKKWKKRQRQVLWKLYLFAILEIDFELNRVFAIKVNANEIILNPILSQFFVRIL